MPVAKGQAGVKTEMHKFKAGDLHSGSKHGPVVTNPKQAIAIALSSAGMSKHPGMKSSATGSATYTEAEMKQGYRSIGKENPAGGNTGPTSDTKHEGYKTATGGNAS